MEPWAVHGLYFLRIQSPQTLGGSINIFLIKITTNLYCGIAYKNQIAHPIPPLAAFPSPMSPSGSWLLAAAEDRDEGQTGREIGGSRDSQSCRGGG